MAPAGTRVEVHGAVELRRALRHMDADLKDLTKINKSVAETVAEAARDRAPRRSGKLAKNVRAGANQRAGYVLAGGKRVPYAGPIHFGWHARHIVPQPFIYDALDARGAAVVDKYVDRVDELVRRVGRETP
jgi:hypothetical protein